MPVCFSIVTILTFVQCIKHIYTVFKKTGPFVILSYEIPVSVCDLLTVHC